MELTAPRSLQSPAPLERVPANSGQEPVHQIAFAANLLLDPPYQRGSVWGPHRRRNLIRSLLLGIPVGNIFWNRRPDGTLAVVDGKQRIETVRMFLAGDLDVPASWFPADKVDATHETDDGPYVWHHDLAEQAQGRFWRCSMTTQLTDLRTVAEEAALFELINFGGLPQGASDAT